MVLPFEPLALIDCAVDADKFSSAVLRAVAPLAFVEAAVWPDERTDPVIFSVLPLAIVLSVHLRDVCSASMVLTLAPVALVVAAIRELQVTLAVSIACTPLSVIDRPVSVNDATFSLRDTSVKTTLVSAAVWEGHIALFIDVDLHHRRDLLLFFKRHQLHHALLFHTKLRL